MVDNIDQSVNMTLMVALCCTVGLGPMVKREKERGLREGVGGVGGGGGWGCVVNQYVGQVKTDRCEQM